MNDRVRIGIWLIGTPAPFTVDIDPADWNNVSGLVQGTLAEPHHALGERIVFDRRFLMMHSDFPGRPRF